MPTLRQLQYLVALEDTAHFGQAAASIPVTQPTLSQQLKELEGRLDVKLVERGKPVPIRVRVEVDDERYLAFGFSRNSQR